MIREYLIRESIDQSTGLDIKKIFDELIDEIGKSNLADLPGGQELITSINQYANEIDKLEASGQTADISNKLMKVFQFNGEYIDLKNGLAQYKYSPGNIALLAIQGAPNQLMGTINWWAKRGMKLKRGAKFKVVLRPIFQEDTTNDYTENIKNEIYKEFSYSKVSNEVKAKIKKTQGEISDSENFKGFELYNMWMGKPKDAAIDSLLTTLQGRNELSQFMLMALGLKPSDRKEGYKIGHLYSRDQVEPTSTPRQSHQATLEGVTEEQISAVDALIDEMAEGLIELNNKESQIEDKIDETGAALFHDVINEIKEIKKFGDPETSANFFQALLELNDRIIKLRSSLTTYQYSTRNLLFLAMQADDLSEVGPRTYWFIQNKKPRRDAHGKVMLTPITDENPQELANEVKDREITASMIKNNMLRKTFLSKGITFNEEGKVYTTKELYNILYNRPADFDIESLTAWDFQLARFYLDLTGLKKHLAKGYEVAIVYDATDVEQIPGTDSFEQLVKPMVSDISYDGDTQKLVAIKKTVLSMLAELRNNTSLKVDDNARIAVANKCLYHNALTNQPYKTPAILTGRGKERDAALYDFDLMRNEKPGGEGLTPGAMDEKSQLIGEIGRIIHLLVHEIAHYNRGPLTSDYTGKPKSQADYIYHEFFDLKPGNRIYFNPNDMGNARHQAIAKATRQVGGRPQWMALGPEEQEKRINAIVKSGSLRSGLLTNYTEANRYYRETQAEVIAGMVMRALKIPTKMVGSNLALLSNIDGAKDLDNTPANEAQFYIDTTSAILRKIHSKLDVLDEHHQSLKTMIEQILNNKDLLN